MSCGDSTRDNPTKGVPKTEVRDASVDAADAAGEQPPTQSKPRESSSPSVDSGPGDRDASPTKPPAADGSTPDRVCSGSIAVRAAHAIPTVWLVVDGSASLAEQRDTATHWAWLRSALLDAKQGFVKQYEERVRWGLMIYSGSDPSATLPDAGVQGCPALITVDPTRGNFDAIARAYPAEAPGGSSPTHLALEHLLMQLPADSRDTHIVLLTDGMSNNLCELGPSDSLGAASDVTPRILEATRRLRDAGVLLHVVSVGGREVNALRQLDAIAKAAGGGAFSASNATQLQRALDEIAELDAPCDLALEGHATGADPCDAEVRVAGEKIACGPDGFRIVDPHLLRLQGAACTRFLQQASLEAQISFECGEYAPAPGADCPSATECRCDSTKLAGTWRDDRTATVFVMLARNPSAMPESSVEMLRDAFSRSKLDLRVGSLLFPSMSPSTCACVNDNPQHWIPGPGACCLNAISGGCYVSTFGSSDQLGFAPAAEWFAKVPSLLQPTIMGGSALDTALSEAERAWSTIAPAERLATILFSNTAAACEPESRHYQRAASQVDGTVPMFVVGSASDPTIQSDLESLALLAGTSRPLQATDAARLGDSLALLAALKHGRCRFEFEGPVAREHLHLLARASDGTTREIPYVHGGERGYRISGTSAVLTEPLCAEVLAGAFSDLHFETGCVMASSLTP